MVTVDRDLESYFRVLGKKSDRVWSRVAQLFPVFSERPGSGVAQSGRRSGMEGPLENFVGIRSPNFERIKIISARLRQIHSRQIAAQRSRFESATVVCGLAFSVAPPVVSRSRYFGSTKSIVTCTRFHKSAHCEPYFQHFLFEILGIKLIVVEESFRLNSGFACNLDLYAIFANLL